MTGRFEWHITCPQSHATDVARLADLAGIVFSQIAGCPILGAGTYCYLTGYDTESNEALARVAEIERLLAESGIPILRSKIENIVYDTKTGVDTLSQPSKVYVLVEHEQKADIQVCILGVYSTPAKRQAARDTRIAKLREESPEAIIWNEPGPDEDEDDQVNWDIDLVEEEMPLDDEEPRA